MLLLNLTLVNVRVFIFNILTFETLDTDFKCFNPNQYVSRKKHFHTNTTMLIHDLTFDVSTFKGIILKHLIQGIAFKDYTSCQVMKELSYGSEYTKKIRPVYRVRFP